MQINGLTFNKCLPVERSFALDPIFNQVFYSSLNETSENGPCWPNEVLPKDSNLCL